LHTTEDEEPSPLQLHDLIRCQPEFLPKLDTLLFTVPSEHSRWHLEERIHLFRHQVPINAAGSLQVRIATAAEASGPIKTVFHSWPFPDQVPVVQRRGNGYVLELDNTFDLRNENGDKN
jgi:hypothetical protein